MGKQFIDLTGQKYNRLTVVRLSEERKFNRTTWVCVCDCGKEVLVAGNALRNGNTKSCGCYNRDVATERLYKLASEGKWGNSSPDAISDNVAINELYLHQYKRGAMRRGYAFELDGETFIKLTSSDCYYCGAKPKKVIKTTNHTYVYNGIDRVDNSKGYIEGNVVPCCEKHNKEKRNVSVLVARKMIEFLDSNLEK